MERPDVEVAVVLFDAAGHLVDEVDEQVEVVLVGEDNPGVRRIPRPYWRFLVVSAALASIRARLLDAVPVDVAVPGFRGLSVQTDGVPGSRVAASLARNMRPRALTTILAAALLAIALAVAGAPTGPSSASAATCADHPNQASAQAAKDTRDADGDGVYCESLPCPCAAPGQDGSSSSPKPKPAPKPKPSRPRGTSADPRGCIRVGRVVDVGLSRTRYPAVREHWESAIKRGYPRVLTIHRKGADRRRRALLAGHRTRAGYDRDEYPMAMARTRVRASVKLVPSSQNRGAGASQGAKLRRYCSGQRFRIVWY